MAVYKADVLPVEVCTDATEPAYFDGPTTDDIPHAVYHPIKKPWDVTRAIVDEVIAEAGGIPAAWDEMVGIIDGLTDPTAVNSNSGIMNRFLDAHPEMNADPRVHQYISRRLSYQSRPKILAVETAPRRTFSPADLGKCAVDSFIGILGKLRDRFSKTFETLDNMSQPEWFWAAQQSGALPEFTYQLADATSARKEQTAETTQVGMLAWLKKIASERPRDEESDYPPLQPVRTHPSHPAYRRAHQSHDPR